MVFTLYTDLSFAMRITECYDEMHVWWPFTTRRASQLLLCIRMRRPSGGETGTGLRGPRGPRTLRAWFQGPVPREGPPHPAAAPRCLCPAQPHRRPHALGKRSWTQRTSSCSPLDTSGEGLRPGPYWGWALSSLPPSLPLLPDLPHPALRRVTSSHQGEETSHGQEEVLWGPSLNLCCSYFPTMNSLQRRPLKYLG